MQIQKAVLIVILIVLTLGSVGIPTGAIAQAGECSLGSLTQMRYGQYEVYDDMFAGVAPTGDVCVFSAISGDVVTILPKDEELNTDSIHWMPERPVLLVTGSNYYRLHAVPWDFSDLDNPVKMALNGSSFPEDPAAYSDGDTCCTVVVGSQHDEFFRLNVMTQNELGIDSDVYSTSYSVEAFQDHMGVSFLGWNGDYKAPLRYSDDSRYMLISNQPYTNGNDATISSISNISTDDFDGKAIKVGLTVYDEVVVWTTGGRFGGTAFQAQHVDLGFNPIWIYGYGHNSLLLVEPGESIDEVARYSFIEGEWKLESTFESPVGDQIDYLTYPLQVFDGEGWYIPAGFE